MPPPGSHRKDFATSLDVDQPIDPNEPTYCVCHQVWTSDPLVFLYLFNSFIKYPLYFNICNSGQCSSIASDKAVLFLIIQVSFGDMIACDNENVSPHYLYVSFADV